MAPEIMVQAEEGYNQSAGDCSSLVEDTHISCDITTCSMRVQCNPVSSMDGK
jgi:hypothetical protein